MRKLFLSAICLTLVTSMAIAQKNKDEEEVLKINADYDKAILKGDLSFHEKLLAPEYVSFNPDGSFKTRTEVLERIKNEKNNPTFKLIDLNSDDVKVKVAGNLAVVTAAWDASGKTIEPGADLHKDTGYYTAVFEKRNGNWMLISDHATEKPHTAEELEPALKKASDDYDKALKTKDTALFSKIMADDYMSTSTNGVRRNKAEDIAQMTSADLVFTLSKVDDKKFRIYRNMAVETGKYITEGTFKGKPFAETGMYTSTWLYKDGKWQMVADHASVINPQK